MTFLIVSLRKRTSLSLGAPEVQIHDFLNRILDETDRSIHLLKNSKQFFEWKAVAQIHTLPSAELKATVQIIIFPAEYRISCNCPNERQLFRSIDFLREVRRCLKGSQLFRSMHFRKNSKQFYWRQLANCSDQNQASLLKAASCFSVRKGSKSLQGS